MSETSRWREEKAGIGPKPVKVNGRNFYFEDEADAYLDQLAVGRHDNGGAVAGDQAEHVTATYTNEGATGD